MIADYTREAGLRNLERQLGSLSRKVARQFVEGRKRRVNVGRKQVEKLLGPAPFFHEVAGREPAVGVVTGLAATAAGGEILLIEATRMSGRKNLMLTGQLGDVMKESAHAALSYLRSQADALKHIGQADRRIGRSFARAGRCDAQGGTVGWHCAYGRARLAVHQQSY